MKKLRNAISLVIQNDEGKVFVVKRSMSKNTFPGHLSLPSIYLLENESFADAATRIAKDRLGLSSIVIQNKEFAVSEIVERPENMLQMYNFFVQNYSGDFLLNKDDYDSGQWMYPEELHKHIMTHDNGHMGECTRNLLKHTGLLV